MHGWASLSAISCTVRLHARGGLEHPATHRTLDMASQMLPLALSVCNRPLASAARSKRLNDSTLMP